LIAMLALLHFAACGSEDPDSEGGAAAAATPDASPDTGTDPPETPAAGRAAAPPTIGGEVVGDPLGGCSRGTLEPDFESAPLAGPAVVEGALPPGDYLISTTYLQLRQEPEAQRRFGQLMQPIMAELAARPGLLAISVGSSRACGVARTLSVWQDDIAMLGFVGSAAHGAAVASVQEVSRGGSLVTHWAGNETQASWPAAAEHAGRDEGPFY
jgi:hypothetical protein